MFACNENLQILKGQCRKGPQHIAYELYTEVTEAQSKDYFKSIYNASTQLLYQLLLAYHTYTGMLLHE